MSFGQQIQTTKLQKKCVNWFESHIYTRQKYSLTLPQIPMEDCSICYYSNDVWIEPGPERDRFMEVCSANQHLGVQVEHLKTETSWGKKDIPPSSLKSLRAHTHTINSAHSSSNWILMSCQPHRVTSGQSNSGHKQIHISKLFSHIYQPSLKSVSKTNQFANIKHTYTNVGHKVSKS